MYVARILYPVEVLGPGKRVGIWFCGCPRRCKGCSNPELWEFQERYQTTPERVYRLIRTIVSKNAVDGFTITGGDPMAQSDDLQKLLLLLQRISRDILIYTGYQKEELNEEQLKNIAVLIDGEYIEERNTNCVLRGSDNQRIYILNRDLSDKYAKYYADYRNQIQNFMTADGVISVGIHRPGFIHELNETVSEKGLNNM